MKKFNFFLSINFILSFILTGCQAAPVQSQGEPTLTQVAKTDSLEQVTKVSNELETTPDLNVNSTQVVAQETNATLKPTQPPQPVRIKERISKVVRILVVFFM